MKKMTKKEAMAQIQALNTNLPPRVEGERHLVQYLEQIIIALDPLTDNEPVSEVASKLLFEWTDLFTYQENDEKNLRGLPELMLAMGADLLYTEWKSTRDLRKGGTVLKGTSTITRLPKLTLLDSDDSTPHDPRKEKGTPLLLWKKTPYFLEAFLTPYFDLYEDARIFKTLTKTNNIRDIYTQFLTANGGDKEKLLARFANHAQNKSSIFTIEQLLHLSGKDTFLSHVFKIGGTSNLLHEKTKHYKKYKKQISASPSHLANHKRHNITQESLDQLINEHKANPERTVTQARPQEDSHYKSISKLTEAEKTTIANYLTVLVKNKEWDSIEYLIDLGISTAFLSQQLTQTTTTTLATTDPSERAQALETMKAIRALGAEAHPKEILDVSESSLLPIARFLMKDTYAQLTQAFPHDVFQILFSCDLFDMNSVSRLNTTEAMMILTPALMSEATHPSRQKLRAHYREQLESNPNLSPLMVAIYCVSQTNAQKRFFGLTQATFERLLLSETTQPLDFIHQLFRIMDNQLLREHDGAITRFKDALIEAIQGLSPEVKARLNAMNARGKTCLALDLLKTRQHKNAKKSTTHYETLLRKLAPTGSHYTTYDSSDDEAEKIEDSFEPTDEENTAIRIFKDLTPPLLKPVEFYLHLLNQRLHLASAIVRSGHFNVNEEVNWIQQNINGVALNYAAGNVALKLWADTQAPVSTSIDEKISLTQFLIEHGLSIFSLLDAAQSLKALGENDMQRALSGFINLCYETGMLEEHFHTIPLNNLTKHKQKALSTLITGDRPSPIMALLHLCESSITEADIKKHFMQPLTEGQTLGLTHLLKALATTPGSILPSLQKKLAEQVGGSPDLVTEFKQLKENKTTCALFMILKYQPAYYLPSFREDPITQISPYAASPYTLFKQKHWPKPVPVEVQRRDIINAMPTVVGVV